MMGKLKPCLGGMLLTGMLLTGLLALAACGPLPPAAPSGSEAPPSVPQATSPIEPTPTDFVPAPEAATDASTLPPAALEVQQQLARQLAIDPQSVSVLSVEATNWPDSCLGAEQPGEMCAAVITPGFKITLDADGQDYVLHTNEDGSNYRVVESSTP